MENKSGMSQTFEDPRARLRGKGGGIQKENTTVTRVKRTKQKTEQSIGDRTPQNQREIAAPE